MAETAQEAPARDFTLQAACRLLLTLKPTAVDSEAVSELCGGKSFATHRELGEFLDVPPNTISASWRKSGMPGAAGDWRLGPILDWLLNRNKTNAERSISRSTASESELRLRLLELDIERKEREESAAAGDLLDRGAVERTLRALLASSSKRLQQIPNDLAPTIPQELASAIIATLRRAIDRELVAMAESLGRDVLRETDDIWDRFLEWRREQCQ